MKTLPTFISSLAFSALLLTAQAQAPATSHDTPQPTKPASKMATLTGQDAKTLGHKMVRKSKPFDGIRVRASQLHLRK